MNIFVGLCGLGSRFKNAGYNIPKYLVIYHGAPMIYHSVETIGIEGRIHFIVKKEHLQQFDFLEKLLLGLGDEIIAVDGATQGAAESLLLAKPYVTDLDAPMLSVNCDQYMDWKPYLFQDELQRNSETSYVVTYNETSPKCSYIREENGSVVEVREKKVISHDATIGYYHWAHTRDFFHDAEQMILDDHKENGEYYMAPVYNYTIARGLAVKKFSLAENQFWPVGTPEDLIEFQRTSTRFD